jgi:alpha-1,3-rhamnosyltransferase
MDGVFHPGLVEQVSSRMKDRPLISTIVPAWNHERFVGDALRSLIGQTYPCLELIVLDDGSTDGTYARIQELRPELDRRFVRVDIATKQNEGSSAAISWCLGRAQGDLVFMLDSDDVAQSDAIECLYPYMASQEVALAVGDNEYIDGEGAKVLLDRDGERHATLLAYYTNRLVGFSPERDFGSYRSLIQGNYVPNGWLLRRSCVAEVGGYSTDWVLDDWPLLIQLAKKYRFRFAGRVLAKYRIHENNASARNRDRLRFDTARILLQERAYCRQHGFEREWRAHAHRVLETMPVDDIRRLAEMSVEQDSPSGRMASLEDLVQLARYESDLVEAKRQLSRAIDEAKAQVDQAVQSRQEVERLLETERSRFVTELDRAAERLREVEQDRSRLSSRLDEARAALGRMERGYEDALRRVNAELTTTESRLAAIESSRTWRWSTPLRKALDVRRRSPSRRWEVCLEPAKTDATSLGGLEVTGWAFHRDSAVVRIEVSIQGHAPLHVESGIERADVGAAFPFCDVGRPGFRTTIQAIEDPVVLEIAIFCADGRSERVVRRLHRTAAMSARAREIYGATNRSPFPPLGRVRAILTHGAIGTYIWESTRIRGWIRGKGEAEALARASDSLPGSPVIVEIGTFLGCSTVLLAGPRKRHRSGRVHCVDTFSMSGEDGVVPVYRAIAETIGMPMRQAFERNMRRAGVLDWITVHEMTSHEAARKWTTPIDMLYLDGDVSIDGSREIFLDWSQFLRPGGILAINGTAARPSRIGAFKVVQEFVHPPDFEDVRRVDHITFARKCGETAR